MPKTYDRDGSWASQGAPCPDLDRAVVNSPLPDPMAAQIHRQRELFWLGVTFNSARPRPRQYGLTEVDLVASLTEFTAASIARSYSDFSTSTAGPGAGLWRRQLQPLCF